MDTYIHLSMVGFHKRERRDAIYVKYAFFQANEERRDAIPLFLASDSSNLISDKALSFR